MSKEQYSQNNLRWPVAATARTSTQLFNPHTSRAWVPLISCSASAHLMSGCSAPTHLVLGFGSSCAWLLSPHSSRAQLWLISCSTLAHLVLSFGSSHARLLSLGQTMSASSSATHCLMKAIIHILPLRLHAPSSFPYLPCTSSA
jgi:hypothetical protein